MASQRYLAMQEEKRQEQLDRIESMIAQLLGAGKSGKAAELTGDVEPFEVPASELAGTPTLVPVAKTDSAKKK